MINQSSLRAIGLAGALLLGTSGFALATPSGTTITNTISLAYTTNGTTITDPTAASVSFVVDTGIDFSLSPQDGAATVTATQGEDDVVLTYLLTNTSNDTVGFDVNVSSTGDLGLTFDATAAGTDGTYYIAYGPDATYVAANATVYDPTGTVNLSDLDENDDVYIYIIANVPTTAADGQTDTFTVTATALNEGTNVVTTELTGQGPNVVDIVFADPGTDGVEAADEDLVISAPDVTGTKTQAVINENLDGTFNCGTGLADAGAEAFIPGACIEYTISVTNGSGASIAADALVITDALPTGVTYVAHNVGTFDTVTLSGTTVTGNLATLAIGDTASFTVRATVD